MVLRGAQVVVRRGERCALVLVRELIVRLLLLALVLAVRGKRGGKRVELAELGRRRRGSIEGGQELLGLLRGGVNFCLRDVALVGQRSVRHRDVVVVRGGEVEGKRGGLLLDEHDIVVLLFALTLTPLLASIGTRRSGRRRRERRRSRRTRGRSGRRGRGRGG